MSVYNSSWSSSAVYSPIFHALQGYLDARFESSCGHLLHSLQLANWRLDVLLLLLLVIKCICVQQQQRQQLRKRETKNRLKRYPTVGAGEERERGSGWGRERSFPPQSSRKRRCQFRSDQFYFLLAISRICIFHATMYNIHIYKSFNCTKHKRDASKSQTDRSEKCANRK